ncbi:hypothetical protein [Haloplanus sp. C73]|uniref:hypothetical protein n=1 Tax=Haloplanus sp. C73 TaxID=3421641 RepID=UPI003EBDB6D1
MGGSQSDREEFPSVAEDIGEDPARFLDVDRLEDLELARARIRGIDFIATLRAWKAVERNLASTGVVSEHHRTKVMEWLDERESELEELGDRDERMADVDIEARREATPSTSTPATWVDRDGGERKLNHVDSDRYRAATDGGEDA